MSISRPKPPRLRSAGPRPGTAGGSTSTTSHPGMSIDVASAKTVGAEGMEEVKTPTLSQNGSWTTTESTTAAGGVKAGLLDADLDLDLQPDVAAILQRQVSASSKSPTGTLGLRHSASMDHIGAGSSRIPDFLTADSPDSALLSAEDDQEHDGQIDAEEDEEDGEHWVGGLPREELETMLLRATRVIRERERDLGLAASIGKALLEKNLSLRSKHEDIMRQIAATGGPSDLADHLTPEGTPPLDYDPDSPIAPPHSEALDTPVPESTSVYALDYFHETQTREGGDPVVTRVSHSRQTSIDSPSKSSIHSINLFPDSPVKEGLITSRPASPPTKGVLADRANLPPSISAFAHLQMQTAEAERHLEMLEQQNDALVNQLAELQEETEQQKRDGSRKLRTLDKELEQLRRELEELHQRNAELEGASAAEREAYLAGDGSSSGRGWRRRGPQHYGQAHMHDLAGRSPNAQNFAPRRTSLDDIFKAANSLSRTQSQADELHRAGTESPARSVSVMSEISASNSFAGSAAGGGTGSVSGGDEQERAIVSQLLLKIKDLEEANAAITRARYEMEGKWGKAIEEGNRIRDAYEAVETASVMSSGFGGRDEENFPPHLRRRRTVQRRAPGNRYIIETSRAIRSAMAKERKGSLSQDKDKGFARSQTETSISSGSSSRSGKASGYGGRRTSFNKPKIRITPSMEGLRDENAKTLERQPSKDSLHPHSARSPRRPSKTAASAFLSVAPSGRDEQELMDDYDPSPSPSPAGASMHGRTLYGVSTDEGDGMLQGMTPSSSLGDFAGTHASTSMASIPQSLMNRLESLKQTHQRTLGSEIGSIYGAEGGQGDWNASQSFGDLTKYDAPLPPPASDFDRSEKLAELLRDVEEFGQQSQQAAAAASSNEETSYDKNLLTVTPRRDRSASAPIGSTAHDDDAMSDIALVHFPEQLKAGDLIAWGSGPDSHLLHTLSPQDDGNWRGDQDLLPPGSYRGHHFASADGYELLERASANQPVTWVDDEDFGKPITMKQAEQYKLVEAGTAGASTRTRKRDLLAVAVRRALGLPPAASSDSPSGGMSRTTSASHNRKGSGSKHHHSRRSQLRTSMSGLQIQSAEQIEEQERLKKMLRKRRLQFEQAVQDKRDGVLLPSSAYSSTSSPRRRRGAAGGRSEEGEEFYRGDTGSHDHRHQDERMMEEDVMARALSLTPSRRRKSAMRKLQDEREMHLLDVPVRRGYGGGSSKSSRRSSVTSAATSSAVTAAGPGRLRSGSRTTDSYTEDTGEYDDEDYEEGEGEGDDSEEFEVVELEPSKRRPGRRGTDYWPMSTRSRYKPSVVKNRVEVASAEAIVWVTTWLAFASVVICACLYAFARGPRRILGSSTAGVPASARTS